MNKALFVALIFTFVVNFTANAANISPAQNVGSRFKEYMEDKQKEEVNERLYAPMSHPPSLYANELTKLPHDKAYIYVRDITAQYAPAIENLIDKRELKKTTAQYINKKLSYRDMIELASSISALYGSPKVKVYIPQQSFRSGVLYINIIESQKPANASQ